jgi:type I restriction enzyme, R subunit
MPTEAEIRLSKIDGQLARAGWSEHQDNLDKEHRLKETSGQKQVHEASFPYAHSSERADYVLKGRNGKPVAIVEAKRDARDPLEGKRQAEDYADHIASLYHVHPFIFLTNGETLLFYDRDRRYVPREIHGFYSPADLERLAFQQQYSQPLQHFQLSSTIAGEGKHGYQNEAVQRVTEAMERRQRKFLLVMATGTGKTRTVIGLVDMLMRARWVQRVLFLADRKELVRQAMGEFKAYLPDSACVLALYAG